MGSNEKDMELKMEVEVGYSVKEHRTGESGTHVTWSGDEWKNAVQGSA